MSFSRRVRFAAESACEIADIHTSLSSSQNISSTSASKGRTWDLRLCVLDTAQTKSLTPTMTGSAREDSVTYMSCKSSLSALPTSFAKLWATTLLKAKTSRHLITGGTDISLDLHFTSAKADGGCNRRGHPEPNFPAP
eukprot:CAMPEP_0174350828 /NCGR_PEP_ID=MMETSP0811_2-20130205/8007_1 /TAXON_ID=73025 ORGANISM="Eutreptiella gymnastica-like, Strain CCMP1594" /NCGR_SAMPLE_ID=MMETSP0811_2 /ASSEMBLY_ACC=CAM_ASM_000667 /LENGTH=137 /DNA_ID=CAMNT_0015479499 /DNA_START=468 /DNA_END=881 /DNA_ORIENTATION=-